MESENITDGAEMPIRDRRGLPFIIVDRALVLDPSISVYTKMVYVALCAYANWTTGQCWPSIRSLTSSLSIDRNTVRRAIRELEDLRLVISAPRANPVGGQTSNLFTLLPLSKMAHTVAKQSTQLGFGGVGEMAPQGSNSPGGVGDGKVGGWVTGDGGVGEMAPPNMINRTSCKEREAPLSPPIGGDKRASKPHIEQYRALMTGFQYDPEVLARSKGMQGAIWAAAKELDTCGFSYDDTLWVIEQLRPRFKQFGPAAVAKWAPSFVKRQGVTSEQPP